MARTEFANRHTAYGTAGEFGAYRSARRELTRAWLAQRNVHRRVGEVHRGGECLFLSVAALVDGVDPNWLRALTLAYARTHPDMPVPIPPIPGMNPAMHSVPPLPVLLVCAFVIACDCTFAAQ